MTEPAKRRRWYPRFTLRTLFVVVTIVGVTAGWFGAQWMWVLNRRDAIDWISQNGHYRFTKTDPLVNPKPMPWQLRMFGEHGVSRIYVVLNPEERWRAAKLKRLFPEAEVWEIDWEQSGSFGFDMPSGTVGLNWTL